MIRINHRAKSFTPKTCFQTSVGFTLVEMLVSIVIVTVLGALVFAGYQMARRQSDKVATANSLKQVGTAMSLYVGEHDGYLPGPMLNGQRATYNSKSGRTLGYHLWSYLGAPAPIEEEQFLEVLTNPANERYRLDESSPVYIVCKRLDDPDFSSRSPWGYPASDPSDQANALKYVQIKEPSRNWAVQDADALHPVAQAAGWRTTLPPTPPLGDKRMTLYFDWHVEAVPAEEMPSP